LVVSLTFIFLMLIVRRAKSFGCPIRDRSGADPIGAANGGREAYGASVNAFNQVQHVQKCHDKECGKSYRRENHNDIHSAACRKVRTGSD